MIAAALCWFDEPPETLDRCVRSLAGVADVLVALDGRWALYPAAVNVSPLEQAEAIHSAASEIGIPVVDESCPANRPWASQIEKRTALMQLAAVLAPWTLVIDADEYVDQTTPDALQVALRDTASDVAEIAISNTGSGIFDTRPHARRRVYRASAQVTIDRGHNGYRAYDGRWLNGDLDHVELEAAVDCFNHLHLVHDRDARSPARVASSTSYYRLRNRFEEEWAAA